MRVCGGVGLGVSRGDVLRIDGWAPGRRTRTLAVDLEFLACQNSELKRDELHFS